MAFDLMLPDTHALADHLRCIFQASRGHGAAQLTQVLQGSLTDLIEPLPGSFIELDDIEMFVNG